MKYDITLLDELNDYINYCTRFAWCALTQVTPMKIDYSTYVCSSRSHIRLAKLLPLLKNGAQPVVQFI